MTLAEFSEFRQGFGLRYLVLHILPKLNATLAEVLDAYQLPTPASAPSSLLDDNQSGAAEADILVELVSSGRH
jgi:hypothetical protein